MSATVYNLILSPRDLEASVDESKYKDEEGNADLTAYQAALQAKKDLVLDGVLAVLDLDPGRLWRTDWSGPTPSMRS